MTDAIAELVERAGTYRGEGINHDRQPFVGTLTLRAVAGVPGVALEFMARGEGGEVFHAEHTLIGPGEGGRPTLVTLGSNGGGLLVLPLRREEAEADTRTLVFGVGDPADRAAFRMEVAVDLHPDGALGYRYSWGLPDGDFAPRSGLRLVRAAGQGRGGEPD